MDCPSEENLIRMKLDEIASIEHMDFDLPGRKLKVFHSGDLNLIENALKELNLNSRLVRSTVSTQTEFKENSKQKKLLYTVLAINFGFFLVEMATGWISHSLGLVADSLDMLADSIVYGLSLMAVGTSVIRKKRIARFAGYFQVVLALIGFIEVIRRFTGSEQMPEFKTMIIVSVLALIANSICLYLLRNSNSNEAHMKASMIFTSNDVMINLGVILAGVLVYITNSNLPDLIVGAIVFLLVTQGARRILKLGQ